MDNLVKVIIPIYRTTLKDWERASLDNTLASCRPTPSSS